MSEPIVLTECEATTRELRSFAGGAAELHSTRNPLGSGVNEDVVAAVDCGDGRGVLIIADGAGGLPAGAEAAATAAAAVVAAVTGGPGSLREAILDGFERANAEIIARAVGSGTTLLVAEISDATLRCYHAGDSGALVTGQRGKLKLVSLAHSPVSYGVEAGLLDEREALEHDDRSVVSNLVGFADMRIDVGPPLELARRDTVVLASDGLFDNLSLDEIADSVRTGPLHRARARLGAMAAQRMSSDDASPSKPDDLSFALFRRC